MKVQKYEVLESRILRDRCLAKVGDIVYDCMTHDYGCANNDTRLFGIEHISVTKNADGLEPFFTIPVSHLKKVD